MKKLVNVLLLMVFSMSLFSQSMAKLGIPYYLPQGAIKPLTTCEENNLEDSLEKQLKANKNWASLIAQKKMAVSLVDLSDPNNVRFAQVNGNSMMYAASLPKIAVLLAAMDAIDKKELKATPEIWSDMRLMISKSNNQATTRMIDRVGFDKIQEVLTDPRYKLYDQRMGGGLWVGKRYAGGGAKNPDPMKGLSHAATVTQVARFYYLLANGQLVNPQRSQQMLEIMENPGLHHKFVNTLDQIAPDARLFRKSGSWGNFHSDSIMVWEEHGWRKYILVALVEDAGGEQIMRQLVGSVEQVMQKENRALASSK